MGQRAKRVAAKKSLTSAEARTPKAEPSSTSKTPIQRSEANEGGEKLQVRGHGSTPQERYRQVHAHCDSDFRRVARMFGIEGDTPLRADFRHPEDARIAHPEMLVDGIFTAMSAAILDVLDAQYRREMGLIPGTRQTWEQACDLMRCCTLARLRHKRRQHRRRRKKKPQIHAIVDDID